jgi:hypothetical protein
VYVIELDRESCMYDSIVNTLGLCTIVCIEVYISYKYLYSTHTTPMSDLQADMRQTFIMQNHPSNFKNMYSNYSVREDDRFRLKKTSLRTVRKREGMECA